MSKTTVKISGVILFTALCVIISLTKCGDTPVSPDEENFRYIVTTIRNMSLEEFTSNEPFPYWDWPLEFEFQNNPTIELTGRTKMAFVGWVDNFLSDNQPETFGFLTHPIPGSTSIYDTVGNGWNENFKEDGLLSFFFHELVLFYWQIFF